MFISVGQPTIRRFSEIIQHLFSIGRFYISYKTIFDPFQTHNKVCGSYLTRYSQKIRCLRFFFGMYGENAKECKVNSEMGIVIDLFMRCI